MARGFYVNGESLVSVKANPTTLIGSLTQLGLSADPIIVSDSIQHNDVTLDAWGGTMPNDVQVMLGAVNITINFIHYDLAILDECLRLSFGNAPVIGQTSRAGTFMGNGAPRFANNNYYIGLNILSPVGNRPYRFYFAYMTGNPFSIPLGTAKSITQTSWRAIPFNTDPWNNGLGAQGVTVWDTTLDN